MVLRFGLWRGCIVHADTDRMCTAAERQMHVPRVYGSCSQLGGLHSTPPTDGVYERTDSQDKAAVLYTTYILCLYIHIYIYAIYVYEYMNIYIYRY